MDPTPGRENTDLPVLPKLKTSVVSKPASLLHQKTYIPLVRYGLGPNKQKKD